jgi:hypothetical protein
VRTLSVEAEVGSFRKTYSWELRKRNKDLVFDKEGYTWRFSQVFVRSYWNTFCSSWNMNIL